MFQKPKIFHRLSLLTTLLVLFAFLVSVTSYSLLISRNDKALAATSSTINFQARLLTDAGDLVPDGNYHVEFKLFNASSSSGSSQGSCSGDANCLWTETRTTGDLVRVVNGYMTVNLGSVTAFGSSIDWDQELWLTMNIGGAGGGASWDGEMTPRLQLSAVPYAFKAGQLAKRTGADTSTLDFATQTGARSILLPDESGTICLQSSANCGFAAGSGDADYIQNGTSPQTADFNITGDGTVGDDFSVGGDILLGASSSIGWGGDTFLWRSAANTLQTNADIVGSSLWVNNNIHGGGNLDIGGTGLITGILTTGAGGKTAITISDSGAQNSGITIGGDTNLYRSAANELTTDDSLVVQGTLSVVGDVTLDSASEIIWNSDTNLYRSAADTLHTDDTFRVENVNGESLQLTNDSNSVWLRSQANNTADWLIASGVGAESEYRFIANIAGGLEWGNGTDPTDTNLYRGTANRLTTDDTFQAAAYRVGGTAGASVTCSGGQFLQNQVVNGGIVTGGSCAAGGGASSLQAAYEGGNTITTNNTEGDIDITLTQAADFIIDIGSGATAEFQIESNGTDILQIASAGQLQLDTTGSSAGILIGGDAQLYRSGSNTLSTGSGDALTVNGTLTVSGSGNLIVSSSGNVQVQGSNVNVTRASTGQNAYLAWVTGDTDPRFQINADGTLNWGPGNAALDTNLYRSAANTLRTNDSFIVQPASNNTSAFLVQSNGGTNNVLQVDTSNSRVAIGIGTTAPAQRLTINAGANYGWNDYIGLTDGTRTGYIGLTNSAGTLGFRTGETGDTAYDYLFFGQDGSSELMTLDGEDGLGVNSETSELLTLNNTFSGATSAWIQFQYEGEEMWELYNNEDQFIIYDETGTTGVNRLSVGAAGAYIVVNTDLDNGLDEGLTVENTDGLQLMDLQINDYGDPEGLTASLEIGEGFASSEIVFTSGTPEWSQWVTDDEALGSDSMYFWNIDRGSWTFGMNGDGNASFWSGASDNAFQVLGSNGTDILLNVNSNQGGVVIGANGDPNPSNLTGRGQLRLWGPGTAGAGSRIFFGDGYDTSNSNVWIGEEGSGDSDILILSGESITLDSTNGGGEVRVDGNLDIDGDLELSFSGGTSSTNAICHTGSDIDGTNSGTNRRAVPCSNSPGDIAEWYEVKGEAEPGDLLTITDDDFTYDAERIDPYTGQGIEGTVKKTISKLTRSDSTYQQSVIGVVSSYPAQVYGADVKYQGENPKPVALKGRVPLKVTVENGAIKPGDKLVASSKPGHAMKATDAGYVIGTALGNLDEGDGMIEVFVDLGWDGNGEVKADNTISGVEEQASDNKNWVVTAIVASLLLQTLVIGFGVMIYRKFSVKK